MTIQAIVALPSGTDFTALPETVQDTLRALVVTWPSEWMLGTRAVDGRKLCLVSLASPHPDHPVQAIESLLSQHGLDWLVIGAMEAHSDTVYRNPWPAVSPYLLDVWQYDEEGQQIPGSNVPQTRIPHAWGGYSSFPEAGQ